jgi:hypothetical protein
MKARWQEKLNNDPYYNTNLTQKGHDFALQSVEEIVRKYKAVSSENLMRKSGRQK